MVDCFHADVMSNFVVSGESSSSKGAQNGNSTVCRALGIQTYRSRRTIILGVRSKTVGGSRDTDKPIRGFHKGGTLGRGAVDREFGDGAG